MDGDGRGGHPGGSAALSGAVVDTSALVLLFVPERGADWVRRQWSEFDVHVAPDWVLAESASALLKKVRRGELAPAEGREAIAILAGNPPVRLVATRDLVPAAYEFAVSAHCSLYDAVYATLALQRGDVLLTADAAFARAVATAGVGPEVLSPPVR